MPIGLKVKSDTRGVQTYLGRLRAAFDDLRPALQNAANELTLRMRARFKSKRDPDGNRWKPWAPSTKLVRRYEMAQGKKVSLMVYEGLLRDTSRFIAGRKDIRAFIGQPYGVFHEQPNGPGEKLPRRAFMLSSRGNGRSLAKEDEEYLLNAVRYQFRKLL